LFGRLQKVTNNGAVTTYRYFGADRIAEYAGEGVSATVLRRYVHGIGTDEPVVQFEGADFTNKRFFVQNYQGSVIAMANTAGTVSALYKYGAYGEPYDVNGVLNWSGPAFRYTGQTVLEGAGLYHYKARIYDPLMGRFLQTDPIGSDDDINLYAYTGGDPINGTDPSGTCVWDLCAVETTAVVYVATAALAVHATCVATKCYDKIANAIENIVESSSKGSSNNSSTNSTRSTSPAASPPPEDPNNREKAKDRRARQQQEARDQKARRSGGEFDTGGAPRNNQAQNSQFKSVVKEQNLTKDQANKLHKEITGQNMSREEIALRAKEMFKK